MSETQVETKVEAKANEAEVKEEAGAKEEAEAKTEEGAKRVKLEEIPRWSSEDRIEKIKHIVGEGENASFTLEAMGVQENAESNEETNKEEISIRAKDSADVPVVKDPESNDQSEDKSKDKEEEEEEVNDDDNLAAASQKSD